MVCGVIPLVYSFFEEVFLIMCKSVVGWTGCKADDPGKYRQSSPSLGLGLHT